MMWLVLLLATSIVSVTCLRIEGNMNVTDKKSPGIALLNQYSNEDGILTLIATVNAGSNVIVQVFDNLQHLARVNNTYYDGGYIGDGGCRRFDATSPCQFGLTLNLTGVSNPPYWIIFIGWNYVDNSQPIMDLYLDYSIAQQPDTTQALSTGITFVQIIYIVCFIVAGLIGGSCSFLVYHKFVKPRQQTINSVQVV